MSVLSFCGQCDGNMLSNMQKKKIPDSIFTLFHTSVSCGDYSQKQYGNMQVRWLYCVCTVLTNSKVTKSSSKWRCDSLMCSWNLWKPTHPPLKHSGFLIRINYIIVFLCMCEWYLIISWVAAIDWLVWSSWWIHGEIPYHPGIFSADFQEKSFFSHMKCFHI